MMKRKSKVLVFVLICTMLLTVGFSAFADVIVEPMDAFFALHKDECEYNNYRQYVVNSENGHTYLYVSPESDVTIKGYSNGEKVAIYWLYTDKSGEVWGILGYNTGWFKMSELTVIYDSFSFVSEHQSEMVNYENGSYELNATKEKPITVWNYPGSKSDWFFEYDNIDQYVAQTYTDKNGEVWGYIQYYMGMRNIWVCMTDPYGEEVSEENVTTDLKAEPTEPEELPNNSTVDGVELKADPTPSGKIPMSEGNVRVLIVVGVLIGGVVALTAGIIVTLFVVLKKKKA